MAHSHHGNHHHHVDFSHSDDASVVRRMRFAFLLNFSFTLIELVGGYLSGSVAILADAVHDLGDSLTIGISVYLQQKSKGRPTADFSYGFRRLSLLSATITGLVLIFGSIWIVKESAARLLSDEISSPNGPMMAGLAVIGIVINGVAAWRMSHGSSANERMLSWHLIEDLLGWIAVLIGAVVIWKWQMNWVDPILAIAIAGFVVWNTAKNLAEVILVFLQRTPAGLNRNALMEEFKTVNGVVDVHDLHVWSLDGERHVISLHAVIRDLNSSSVVKERLRVIAQGHGSVHTTIEIESPDETCAENCDENHD